MRRLLCLILCLLFLVPRAPAQGAATVLTLGAVLKNLLDQIDTTIITARNSGNLLELSTAQNLKALIQQLQTAYEHELDVTFDDHINPTIKKTIDQTRDALTDVTTNAQKSADEVTQRIQQIANTLPFRSSMPQFTRIEPALIAPRAATDNVRLKFIGNFIYYGQDAYLPTLTVGTTDYKPTGTNQELDFDVPYATLFLAKPKYPVFSMADADEDCVVKGGGVSLDKVSSVTEFVKGMQTNGALIVDCALKQAPYFKIKTADVTLNVPWEKSVAIGLVHEKKIAHYKMELNGLPDYAVAYQLFEYDGGTTQIVNKLFTSPTFRQCSTKDCGNNDDIDHPYSVSAESGCHLIRNSAGVNTIHEEGDVSGSFISDDGDTAMFKFTTIHHAISPFGHRESGDFSFTIGFWEQCTQAIAPADFHLPAASSWGDGGILRWGRSATLDADSGGLEQVTADQKHIIWKEAHWALILQTYEGKQIWINSDSSGAGYSVQVGPPPAPGDWLEITLKASAPEDRKSVV